MCASLAYKFFPRQEESGKDTLLFLPNRDNPHADKEPTEHEVASPATARAFPRRLPGARLFETKFRDTRDILFVLSVLLPLPSLNKHAASKEPCVCAREIAGADRSSMRQGTIFHRSGYSNRHNGSGKSCQNRKWTVYSVPTTNLATVLHHVPC